MDIIDNRRLHTRLKMSTTQDVQTLLRFLSQDAKVPLAQALGKIKDLQTAKLIT